MNETNKIFISGTVENSPIFSHESHGEKFYSTTLSVERKSGTIDSIPVIISETLKNPESIFVGCELSVGGSVRTSNQPDESGKKRLVIFIFAEDVQEYKGFKNYVEFVGYFCKPPIYRETPYGRQICDVLVAINRNCGKTDYVPCIVWGRNAVRASNFRVGQKIKLVGRFQSREYQKKIADDEYEIRTAYEVSASSIEEIEESED